MCYITHLVLLTLLEREEYAHTMQDLHSHSHFVLDWMLRNVTSSTSRWACGIAKATYMQQILALTDRESGLHFNAATATAAQVAAFSLDDVAARMRRLTPDVWSLLDGLLAADPRAIERRLKAGKAAARRARKWKRGPTAIDLDGDEEMRGDVAEFKEGSDSEEEYSQEALETPGGPSSKDLADERYQALATIVSSCLTSIISKQLTWQ